MNIASGTAASGIVIMKLTIGISNVLLFGTKTKSDVLLNYSRHALGSFLHPKAAVGMATAMKMAFLVNGAFSFPLYLWPLQSNLWAAMYGEDSVESRMNNRRSFALTNYAVVAACAAVAATVHDVQAPLTLLGATVVGYLAFVAPALLILKEGGGFRVIAWVLLGIGAFQAVAGILSMFFK